MTSTCTICDSPNAKNCARCRSTKYCSPECQQSDWPSHSLLCSQYSTHAHRPDPSYKRAILFPPNEANPKLIWVECKTEQDEDFPGLKWESSQVQEHLGGKLGKYDALPEFMPIKRNLLRDRDLSNTLEVICRDTFLLDGSEINKSVVKATHGATGHGWRGPIVALKKKGLGSDPRHYMDIDMQDYRDVVDYFISYRDESVQDVEVRAGDRKGKVRGVKINCRGDQRTFGVEEFSAVNVPVDHPVFFDSVMAPISKLVGMPLRTRKCPPDTLWKDDHSSYTNVPATFLHQNTDDSSGGWWGLAPMEWQDDVRSVLVVRSDGRDVTVQQVEALCHFCQFKMQPLFENAHGAGLVSMSRAEVLGYLTTDGFREYFVELRAKRMMDEGKVGGWETAEVPV